MTREHGDYQTPPQLVDAVLAILARKDRAWARVLEPTAGVGGFLEGLLRSGRRPAEVVAIEAQPSRAEALTAISDDQRGGVLRVFKSSIFDVDLAAIEWRTEGPLLVVGNPPWVTNSELGVLGSKNLPAKSNFLGLRGFDAQTGRSNFDLGTAVWLKLLRDFRHSDASIGLLCKLTVAREVIALAARLDLPIAAASIHRFDARKWFGVSVEACLLAVDVGRRPLLLEVPVYPSLEASVPSTTLTVSASGAVVDARMYSTISHVDGHSSLTWRQGLKHDSRDIMELTGSPGGGLFNGRQEQVDVEAGFLFPLWKGSDVHRGYRKTARYVIVPQRFLGQDTSELETAAPRLWSYLHKHREIFGARRSSIYRNRPPFSIFGVGPYAFSSHKVAVAGFYGAPVSFTLLPPDQGRPAMVDDTVYFVPCESSLQGAAILVALSIPVVHALIEATALAGAKRPITKSLLQRIDVRAAVASSPSSLLSDTISRLANDPHVAAATDLERLPTTAAELLELIHGHAPERFPAEQLAMA